MKRALTMVLFVIISIASNGQQLKNHSKSDRLRVIVTSDGEVDDECSMVRFLLYSNEWDIEAIITSSSQYHWLDHKWAGNNWLDPYINAYEKVQANLVLHDRRFPTAAYLRSKIFLGNITAEGEMDSITAGSQQIVKLLLDESDPRPIWIQAWGGTNTIARALKTIEEKFPDKMFYVAKKIRFFFIWEQDETYQHYIRPHWGKYGIQTIISDQFIAYFYHWKKYLPTQQQSYFNAHWMKYNILNNHGALCALYKAHVKDDKGFEEGDFRSEGDSPAFLATIPNGLRSIEFPNWGGWGGRYVRVYDNVWLDSVYENNYQYPQGRWYSNTAWGRVQLKKEIPSDTAQTQYLRPIWQWIGPVQNDFAARADWCVQPYSKANHPPIVVVNQLDWKLKPGSKLLLNANKSKDPDGHSLQFKWWYYKEAGTYPGQISLQNDNTASATCGIPLTALKGQTIHIICEVKDNGIPQLTRYQRVVVQID